MSEMAPARAAAAADTGAPGAQDTYEVFAIRYGTVRRRAAENFMLAGDPHEDNREDDFHYYVWLARSPSRTFVIDTGFDAVIGRARGRQPLIAPDVALSRLGVAAGEVKDVVITHLHYDHAGNFAMFPQARFHLQEREMMFATGRHMAWRVFSHAFEVNEVRGPGSPISPCGWTRNRHPEGQCGALAGAIAYSLVKHDLDGETDADGTTTSQPDRPAHRPDLWTRGSPLALGRRQSPDDHQPARHHPG